MSRKPPKAEAETGTQEEATRPRPIDPVGRTLDTWGLPLSGPARVLALGDRTDPAIDPEGWEAIPAAPLVSQPVDEALPPPTEPALAPDTSSQD